MSDDMTAMPIDELNAVELTNVSTDFPTLKEGVYRVKIADIELVPNKAKTGKNLRLKLALESPGEFVDGHAAHPGFAFTETISVTETERYDFKPTLAKVALCFFGTKDSSIKWNEIRGRSGDVRLKIEEDEQFGRRNRVQTWIAKKGEAPSL